MTTAKSSSRTAAGWRKRTAQDTSDKTDNMPERKEEAQETTKKSCSESEDSSSSESDEGEDTIPQQPTVPKKKITEAELNQMGAKILRAELMGDEV